MFEPSFNSMLLVEVAKRWAHDLASPFGEGWYLEKILSALWSGELTKENGEDAIFTLVPPEGCATDGDGNVLKTIYVHIAHPYCGPYRTFDEYYQARQRFYQAKKRHKDKVESGSPQSEIQEALEEMVHSFDEHSLESEGVVTADRERLYWSRTELLDAVRGLDPSFRIDYPGGLHAKESCRALAQLGLARYSEPVRKSLIDSLFIESADVARWCISWCDRNQYKAPAFVVATLHGGRDAQVNQEKHSPENQNIDERNIAESSPTFPKGQAGAAKRARQSTVDAWYANTYVVAKEAEGGRPPSRDNDFEAAREKFPDVARSNVRLARKEYAPDRWKKQGRKKLRYHD